MEDKKRLGNERMQSIRMWKHETGLAMWKSNAVALCMLLPGEECDVIGANLRLDTTYTEECLRCAVVAFGFEHPDAFAAWLAITPPEATETVCTCVSAFMKTMLEENNDE